jgi:hypothetical protein
MAHLWVEDAGGQWAILPLLGDRFDLAALCRVAKGATPGGDLVAPTIGASLLRGGDGGQSAWHIVAAPDTDIWLNGLPLRSGFRVLADRDEIQLDCGASCFFSTETLATVAPMPASGKTMICPRCRQAIEPGSDAVRCPRCGLWHHEGPALPCWTYAVTCALCPQPSALDAGFQWTPIPL